MTFQPNIWVCPYLTQIWVKTTQHFLERNIVPMGKKQTTFTQKWKATKWIKNGIIEYFRV